MMKLIRPMVITGPSGSGKSTLLKRLFEVYPNAFAFSVSHTSRQPRPGEVDGKDYHFSEKAAILNAIKSGEFLEHTEFSGNVYGTSLKAVKSVQETGKICVLDLDLPGVHNIYASLLHKNEATRPIYVFIKPPSLDILEQRLRDRGTETEDSLQKRLSRAVADMDKVKSELHLFDHLITNDDLERAYKELESCLKPELDKIASL